MQSNKKFKLGYSILGFSAIIGSSVAIVACGTGDSVTKEQKVLKDIFVSNPSLT
jgi:hypothetical protein